MERGKKIVWIKNVLNFIRVMQCQKVKAAGRREIYCHLLVLCKSFHIFGVRHVASSNFRLNFFSDFLLPITLSSEQLRSRRKSFLECSFGSEIAPPLGRSLHPLCKNGEFPDRLDGEPLWSCHIFLQIFKLGIFKHACFDWTFHCSSVCMFGVNLLEYNRFLSFGFLTVFPRPWIVQFWSQVTITPSSTCWFVFCTACGKLSIKFRLYGVDFVPLFWKL